MKKKQIRQSAAVIAASAILSLSCLTFPTALAAETSKTDPKIVQVAESYSPLALDDKGNVWCMAFHAISVKEGYHPILMMKAKGLDHVVSMSGDLVLRDDGTVWTIESTDVDLSNVKEHVSAELGDPLPELKEIVKIQDIGMLGLAIDKAGKVWLFENAPRWIKNDPTFTLQTKPVLIEGLDHVKDISVSYDNALFLKEDGTLWGIDHYIPVSRIHSNNPSLYDTIRSTKPVQMNNLNDIVKIGNDIALKKDGTVWVWGRDKFAKPENDGSENAVVPFQVAGLSDITDFSKSGDQALFVKKDGTVWGWGYFSEDWILGGKAVGTWKDIFQLKSLTDVASVLVSQTSVVETEAAVKKDGTLWMWGASGPFQSFFKDPMQVDFNVNMK
ncbi:RCC1 domain-containing protein [Paenibacillus sp. GCM10027628]|uniref:RCC1 domain-containing protein n=1 Tax=Paenibacillus sp. GCM10027628 TaxID=3273413 RepID=UPI0036392386